MASEKVYPKGIMGFNKKETQPDWLLGTLVITPKLLIEWLKGDGEQYLTEYKENKQLKLNIAKGDKGLNITVDTWKPKAKASEPDNDLPW